MKLIMQIFFLRVVELGIIKIKQVKVVAKHVHLASTKTVCFPQVAKIAQKENMRIVLVLQLVQDAIRLNIRIKQVNRSVKHLIVVRYQQVVNIIILAKVFGVNAMVKLLLEIVVVRVMDRIQIIADLVIILENVWDHNWVIQLTRGDILWQVINRVLHTVPLPIPTVQDFFKLLAGVIVTTMDVIIMEVRIRLK